MTDSEEGTSQVVHRGVPWYRDASGQISFYNADGGEWVKWAPGVDAPPVPPAWAKAGWAEAGVAMRPPRPRWTSPWRLIPTIGAVLLVGLAVVLVTRPSAHQEQKETRITAALVGQCLAQHGSLDGHPRYSTQPVPCDGPEAAVKVVKVVPSSPGSPLCPDATTGFEIPYAGVQYPHVLCLQSVRPAGP